MCHWIGHMPKKCAPRADKTDLPSNCLVFRAISIGNLDHHVFTKQQMLSIDIHWHKPST